MAEGTRRDVRIAMPDAVELDATLWLPDPATGPQPCLLEALPYRKDDLTSSDAAEYERLRDEFGYAVARVDVRGTGSSGGRATDEYPPAEQTDLAAVIAWLAQQSWCSGAVGMYGTSYSGFNALQLAAERPPALRAVCAIYASDDRYTDDVHLMGGLLKWLDLVDYCHYMTPMNALPPVPARWGDGWRAEWLRRVEEHEPWLLRWLGEPLDGPYWRHGSLRPGYDRITCPVMLVTGWADGYRNTGLRTAAALRAAGTPVRLLAGPWAHASPATAQPGPRIDLVPEMVRWWDRWLRDRPTGVDTEPPLTWFLRRSTRPEPDLDTSRGQWRSTPCPVPTTPRVLPIDARAPYLVVPDIGTAAWISCAGHLPWGQSLDQRSDDERSMVWEWPADGVELVGHPVLRARVSASAPRATLAARLCDVFPDGTSALVTRGVLDLTHRDGHDRVLPVGPGEVVDVELELEACAYAPDAGHRLRLAVSGADWPNTVAPPAPLSLTVHGGELVLPVLDEDQPHAAPELPPGGAGGEDPAGVTWRVEHDVLRRETACVIEHSSAYDTPYGTASEHYAGRVGVDTRTFEQTATSDVELRATYADPGVEVSARATLDARATGELVTVRIELAVTADGTELARRRWEATHPR